MNSMDIPLHRNIETNGTITVNDDISGNGDLYISGDISGNSDVYFKGLPSSLSGVALNITPQGRVFKQISSRRFKSNIESINSEIANRLLSLNPVTFNYTGSNVLSYGLIAEEVADSSFSSIVSKDINGDQTHFITLLD